MTAPGENLTLTGSGNINGAGNSGNNILTGNTGANTLDGGPGADTIIDTFETGAADVVEVEPLSIGPGAALTSELTSLPGPLSLGSGLTFTLHNIGGVTPGSQAEAGFLRAAALWSGYLGDSVNILLDVGFSSLAPGILGSTSSNSDVVSYSAARTALITDQTSASDATAAASLAPGSSLSFYTNNSAGTRVFDNDGSANNTLLNVNSANLKALGITADANGNPIDDGVTADASITFSSSFTFDFDPSNGISAGAIDFVGVAFHEIGHALGFVSGVDIVDIYTGSGPGGQVNLNPYSIFSILDLYRYSAGSVRDLSFGDSTYFSINGGATNLGLFSTGYYQGDGSQASHWKDDLGLGIMDPTAAPAGQAMVVTSLDIQAFDVIGWNLASASVPGSISIDDVSITEGNSGTKALTFTVTRSGGNAAFAVNYATANGTATAGSDYVATSGTLNFGANVNSQTISVTINGDTTFEGNETFFVNLSGATNGAIISDSQGQGTIVNDDAAPQPDLIVSAASVSKAIFYPDRDNDLAFSINFTIQNIGNALAGASTAGVYWSSDYTIAPTDTLLSSMSIPSLTAGATSVQSGPLTAPSVGTGTYYVGIIADKGGDDRKQ